MSAIPVSSRYICQAESMKCTVKTFPSNRFACQSIPPAVSILMILVWDPRLIIPDPPSLQLRVL